MSEHEHKDKFGIAHKCFHKCKNVLFTWQFWLGMTYGYIPEHWLYDNVPPFDTIARLLNIH